MISQSNDTVIVNNVNSSANSSGGNSSTHTSITTTTNGKTTKVESNESGSIHVETVNGETKIQTSPGMKIEVKEDDVKTEPIATKAPVASNSPVKAILPKPEQVKESEVDTLIQKIQYAVRDFLAKLGFGR